MRTPKVVSSYRLDMDIIAAIAAASEVTKVSRQKIVNDALSAYLPRLLHQAKGREAPRG